MLVLEASYTKKVGLPNYSSHQYGLTVKVEINNASQLSNESARLYKSLQSCVDRELQKMGQLPEQGGAPSSTPNGNGNGNGTPSPAPVNAEDRGEVWACTPRQKNLVLKLVEENQLHKASIEALARNRFSKPLRALNNGETSELIDELLEQAAARNANATSPANNQPELEEAA